MRSALHVLATAVALTAVGGTQERCQLDCEAPPSLRILGDSTRPSSAMDLLGNPLSLTRPHPYFASDQEAAVVRFNSTVRMYLPEWDDATHSIGTFHKNYLLKALKRFAVKYKSDDLLLFDTTTPVIYTNTSDPDHDGSYFTDVSFLSEYVVDYTLPYNHSTTDEFYDMVMTDFTTRLNEGNFTVAMQQSGMKSRNTFVKESLVNCTVEARPHLGVNPGNNFNEIMKLLTPHPNPYSNFCKTGCTYFFSEIVTRERPVLLSNCTAKCDFTYRSAEHISVGYSDIAETARLECRDGCQIALKRCQPGYKCSQVAPTTNPDTGDTTYDGAMIICPPGTYRDVSYDQVEECNDCPPGRYREFEKGRYMESCSQCPVGRYVNQTGSSSILQCNRCPAGRYGPEPGLALCECITTDSCEFPQDPSPQDSEKRETFPFEGRW